MASTSETGHAKNVDNLGLLNVHIASYGAKYNPSNPAIAYSALVQLEADARQAVDGVSLAVARFQHAAASRDAAFRELLPTTTRAINTLKASTTSSHTVANAKTIVRRLRGKRAKPIATKAADAAIPDTPQPQHHSVSHLSFSSRADSFDELISLLASIPEYSPNEQALTLDALRAILQRLRSSIDACNSAAAYLSAARSTRNRLLYDPSTGVLAAAKAAKAYIRALFGGTSPEFKEASKVKFKLLLR
ncbi:hypothetical protein [uncultured Acetobacteroides sp.]|uniref:hypothetical protein n=1 Tax=uncultured Acetobacteroides sp. TaxID=1760811 RepID=UPI0029F4B0C7|nr:hypothetical protein [uncultured Acetobacteroides sp.]